MRQHCSTRFHQAKHIGIELTNDLGFIQGFKRPHQAVPRIVHQHINGAKMFNGLFNRRMNAGTVIHIKWQAQHPRQAGQRFGLLRLAQGRDHIPALVLKQSCRGIADAGGRTSDKNGFRLHCSHSVFLYC